MNEKSLRVLEYGKIIDRLVELTSSRVGKKISSDLKPGDNLIRIDVALSETSESEGFLLQFGNPPFGALHDIKNHIDMAKIGAVLNIKQILEVGDCLRSARNVKSFIAKGGVSKTVQSSDGVGGSGLTSETPFPILTGLSSRIEPNKDLEERIAIAIIGESQISDNASSELKRIRREIDNKNNQVKIKLESIIKSGEFKSYLQDALVTMRGDRFVIPVKAEHKANVKGLVHDQSSSGSTYFIEPFAIVELNNELKELHIKEIKEIERILAEFSSEIMEMAYDLESNNRILAELDFIFAKGKLSLEMKGTRPRLSDTKELRLVNARHPLIDKNKVVANTIYMGKDFRTLLITGPNTGGKTVTLKTLGLLALMNQSGLHVPAASGSVMPIYKGIYADIGDEQSIEQSLSTFSSHMKNIVEIMEHACGDSLTLFDELGAGTDPTEGAALAMSILNKLHKLGATTMATTHYSELKEFAIVTEGVENACVEFDVETLAPTYKLLIGVPGKSNAFEISRKLGLSDDIIDGAKNLVNVENIVFEDILTNIEKSRIKAEEELTDAERMKLEAEAVKKKALEREEKVNVQRDEILRKAREEARKIVKESRDEVDKALREIKSLKEEISAEGLKRLEESRKNLKDKMGELGEPLFKEIPKNLEPPKNLLPGENVRILNMGQDAVVVTKPDRSGNLTVQAGIMKINVNVENLKRIKGEKDSVNKFSASKSSGGDFGSKMLTVSTEIDVRGMNVEEATEVIDKFIDDAILANLKNLRVIHGKGTGALRAGLTLYFRKHKGLKSHRFGEFNEGGMGVTVLELK